MLQINYDKQQNLGLFQNFKDVFGFSTVQNYQPLYKDLFELNDTNFNNIQLSSNFFLSKIDQQICGKIDTYITNHSKTFTNKKEIFFKFTPLLNPFKHITGKCSTTEMHLLPSFIEKNTTNRKIYNKNNSAYTECFFVHLACKLKHNENFANGIEYYGSYLGLKNEFAFDIYDDLDYLVKSSFFMREKNKSFVVEDFEDLFSTCDANTIKKKKISLDNEECLHLIDIEDFGDNFDDIFIDNTTTLNDFESIDANFFDNELNKCSETNESSKINEEKQGSRTDCSTSTCSSRTSCTTNSEDDCESDLSSFDEDSSGDSVSSCASSTASSKSQHVMATLPSFPVNIIAMEKFDNTLESLIVNDELTDEKWFAVLMQIVMSLLVYQSAFAFTHNDLHTNNVMYKETEIKFLYYKYKNEIYRVPTYGKIFSIIDFGRSIYKFKGDIYYSDCFEAGGDANSQYNSEPYFNGNKPRLEPNYSFDLCRLGCSIFDFLIEDIEDVENVTSPLTKLIVEWCTDDRGINVLYKKNGEDRYPDFKLYKMIARHVNKHTPANQLKRKEFMQFKISEEVLSMESVKIVNIDNLRFY